MRSKKQILKFVNSKALSELTGLENELTEKIIIKQNKSTSNSINHNNKQKENK
jgi:hypothetical protein